MIFLQVLSVPPGQLFAVDYKKKPQSPVSIHISVIEAFRDI
jgi:hypothetical protein